MQENASHRRALVAGNGNFHTRLLAWMTSYWQKQLQTDNQVEISNQLKALVLILLTFNTPVGAWQLLQYPCSLAKRGVGLQTGRSCPWMRRVSSDLLMKPDGNPAQNLPTSTLQHALNLRDHGFTVLPSAGLDALIPAAKQACERELEQRLDDVAFLGIDPIEQGYSFNEICHRDRNRWDLRVPSQPFDELCSAALARVEEIICKLHTLPVNPGEGQQSWPRWLTPCKPKALMYGSIISRPGALAQRFHRDSTMEHISISSVLPSHRLFQVFIPLVDIEKDASGTQFWPGSHLADTGVRRQREAVLRSGGVQEDNEVMATVEAPSCPAGGIILFDFRTMHRGLANLGDTARPYAYVVCGTGWAKDTENFPADKLDLIIRVLPDEPAKRDAALRIIQQNFPFWDQVGWKQT